jgi:hypothetical protein
LAISVLEDCHARHVLVRGHAELSSLRCACMLGNFYAVNSDDTRALAILNDAVSRACAAHGPNSIIALECKYHLGIAFFIQKNFSAALDCVASHERSHASRYDYVYFAWAHLSDPFF